MTELTAAQTRLWFLHQMNPDDASYHLPSAWYVRGPLHVAALERAVDALATRHGALSSRFVAVDGAPARLPATSAVRLASVSAASIEQAAELAAELAVRPFDFTAGPMLRATLIRLSAGDHLLSMVMHHIASDGYSMQIMRRELTALYEAFDAGRESPLAPLPTTYGDHLARMLSAPPDPAALTYWKEMLADPPTLELPTDRPRPAARQGHGDRHIFDVPRDLLDGVDRLARAEHCTRFTVLLAAYQVLLGKHSGQRDICVGVPVLGRDDPATEGVIGYFAETLVMRGDLSGDPTVRDLLRATWKRLLSGFARRATPFERLLAGADRDRSRTPLFQALLTFMNSDGDRPRLGDLDVETIDNPLYHAKTDLELDVIESPDGIAGVFVYDTALFTGATVGRLARRLLVLLADIVARPGVRLSELRMIDDREAAELVTRWNDTAIAEVPGLAPDRFAAQAAATPDAVAITYDGRDVTYRELDAEVDRVAGLVRDRGPLVAVSLRRGPAMVAALLGVWRAGAAYLPLDPDYPADRIAFVLADSAAGTVLTSRDLADRFGARAVLIDGPAPVPGGRAATRRGDDVAYVLYTSGSTGRPKGVAVPHRALAAFLHAMAELLGPQADRSWLGLTSLSFDISGLEIHLPLTRGGRVVIAGEEQARDGAALVRLIDAAGVTDVQATPSGWRLLLDAGFTSASVDALVGGEALPLPLAADLRARTRRLINVYGPTETTIWSAFWVVPPRPRLVSIGGPIAGTRLHVLDEHGVPAPIGVPGELCVAGDGVAHGYLDRPALTAERFTPDPYGPPGSRLYRTGDRARRLGDGGLEFLGRTDNQVKLRGHRIELGEIEAVLNAHPDVRAAVVAVRDETLVAYVVADTPAADVLAHARAALPAYLVPATVTMLDTLPLTPNGKVDRAALPAPDRPRAAAHVPPRTPDEQRVADAYADVLGLSRVGAHDDFFALGGHSLLATKVTARLGGVAVHELFDHPTVAALAQRLPAVDRPTAEPLRPRPPGTPVPLTTAQLRLWHLQALDDADASYNMFQVLRLRGPLDRAALIRAVDDLAARHETLRTRYPLAAGRPVTELSAVGPAVERLDADGPDAAARLVAARTNGPFTLADAAPVRVGLIRLADDDHVLCLVLHHIAGDGWSLNLLRADLAALYTARRAGGEPPARPTDLDYGDIVLHRPEPGAADFDYWSARLARPTALELPADRPRPDEPTHRGGYRRFRLAADVAEAVEALARTHGTTPFTVLLATWQLLLSRLSGQTDVLVGSVLADRDRPEHAPIVGYFATTVVLRGDLTGDPTVAELIERTRATVLGALAHPHVPFERLPATRPDAPLYRVMFILHSQDADTSTGGFADLEADFFDAGYDQAPKSDLMLEAWRERDGLALQLGYDLDLFEEATAGSLADRFARLCAAVVGEDPGRPVSEIAERAAA